MYAFIKWGITVIIVSFLAAFILFPLDIQQLFQWKIVTVVICGILSLSLYKLRNSLRLDETEIQIQFVDA